MLFNGVLTHRVSSQVSRADILVVAAGKPEIVKGEWVKVGGLVIDCGINHIPGAYITAGHSKISNNLLPHT